MKKTLNNRGVSILGLIFLCFILILVLSYFNISVRSVVQSPTAQDNLHYVSDQGTSVWDRFLKSPFHYLWHDVWLGIFWKSFILNMERIRDGQPTDYQTSAPVVNVQMQ